MLTVLTSDEEQGTMPNVPERGPVLVELRWQVLQLSEISGPAQTFSVDFYLDVCWDDDRVQDEASLKALDWSPRLEISNAFSVEKVQRVLCVSHGSWAIPEWFYE